MSDTNGLFRYHRFAHQVSSQSRYFWSDDVKAFLSDVEESMTDRIFELPANEAFVWRARIGCDWRPIYDHDIHVDDDPWPYTDDKLMPLPSKATEGRANPKGIPVLYVANDRATALSEVRPWISAQVSIAQMKVIKKLKLIDCAKYQGKRNTKFYFNATTGQPSEMPRDEYLEAIWTDIDNAFARPVTRDDKTADYVPTQILTELFRDKGFDGIVFKSSVAEGHNIALFDLESVKIEHRQVVEITQTEYNCKWSGGSIFKSLGDQES